MRLRSEIKGGNTFRIVGNARGKEYVTFETVSKWFTNLFIFFLGSVSQSATSRKTEISFAEECNFDRDPQNCFSKCDAYLKGKGNHFVGIEKYYVWTTCGFVKYLKKVLGEY